MAVFLHSFFSNICQPIWGVQPAVGFWTPASLCAAGNPLYSLKGLGLGAELCTLRCCLLRASLCTAISMALVAGSRSSHVSAACKVARREGFQSRRRRAASPQLQGLSNRPFSRQRAQRGTRLRGIGALGFRL